MSFLTNMFRAKPALPAYSSNVRSYLDTYDDKPVYTIVDLGLAEIAPVAEFDRYIAVILPMTINNSGEGPAVSENELKALHRIEERCIKEAETKGFLYAGHAIVTAAEHMYIAFYCKDKDKGDTLDSLKRICQSNGRTPTRILCKEDTEWGFYLERLYPDIYRRQPLNHQDIIDDIKKHGDSGAKPRAVSFWLYFNTRAEAERCLGEAVSSGYALESIEDMRAGKEDFKGKMPFVLAIRKEMALTVDALNAEAWALIDMAKKYGGEYDGVETEVIKGG